MNMDIFGLFGKDYRSDKQMYEDARRAARVRVIEAAGDRRGELEGRLAVDKIERPELEAVEREPSAATVKHDDPPRTDIGADYDTSFLGQRPN